MKKIRTTTFLIFAGIAISSPVFAAFSIPTIAGIPAKASAAELIVYFFNLSITVGSLIAVVMLMMAGYDYIMSNGDPSKIESAKKRIQNTLLGVAILVSCLILLNTINPQLAVIKINELSKEPKPVVNVPVVKNVGVYLYKGDGKDPLLVQDSKASLIQDNFQQQVKSIKFINLEDYRYGAVLFTEGDFKGNCSYALNDVNDMGAANDNENKPPIGNNTLSSIFVFKALSGSPVIKLYNNIDCEPRSSEYGTVSEKSSVCTVTGKNGFDDIARACPDFKGDVLSIEATPDTGILLKAAAKDKAGKCQFMTAGNSGCLNVIKYGYVYNPDPNSPIKPLSFMLFPLYVPK